MSGQRFGHLAVIKRSTKTDSKGRAFWICKCDCGNILIVRGDNLRRGNTSQCSDCNKHGKSLFLGGDLNGTL